MEIWREIKGYEGFYAVSICGRVASLDRNVIGKNGKTYFHRGKILSPGIGNSGYQFVNLHRDNNSHIRMNHRLVIETFVEKPNDGRYYECNHIDGNKLNNCVTNLEWVTPSENHQHGRRTGLIKPHHEMAGEKNGRAILTEFEVSCIKSYLRDFPYISNKELGEYFGVNNFVISAIRNNRLWESVEPREYSRFRGMKPADDTNRTVLTKNEIDRRNKIDCPEETKYLRGKY